MVWPPQIANKLFEQYYKLTLPGKNDLPIRLWAVDFAGSAKHGDSTSW